MLNICIEPIACPNVERSCYLMFQDERTKEQLCFGKLSEQENDAGEFQYVFEIWQDLLNDELRDWIVVPGIDLTQKRTVYYRSYAIPYFIECCTIPDERSDLEEWLKRYDMTWNDKFEFMIRCRAMTHHSNTYVGRHPTDFIDYWRAKKDVVYKNSLMPNLGETPENVFHDIC